MDNYVADLGGNVPSGRRACERKVPERHGDLAQEGRGRYGLHRRYYFRIVAGLNWQPFISDQLLCIKFGAQCNIEGTGVRAVAIIGVKDHPKEILILALCNIVILFHAYFGISRPAAAAVAYGASQLIPVSGLLFYESSMSPFSFSISM